MGTMRFSFAVEGLQPMTRKLKTAFDDGDTLLGKPWRESLERIGKLGEDSAIVGAPMGPSGRTIARMTHKVQKAAMPKYVVIKTTAKSDRGYPYPRTQEYSPFAQSRYRKGRNRNKGWFRKSIERIQGPSENMLDQAAREIEARWAL